MEILIEKIFAKLKKHQVLIFILYKKQIIAHIILFPLAILEINLEKQTLIQNKLLQGLHFTIKNLLFKIILTRKKDILADKKLKT